jgi:hypothetical protein
MPEEVILQRISQKKSFFCVVGLITKSHVEIVDSVLLPNYIS